MNIRRFFAERSWITPQARAVLLAVAPLAGSASAHAELYTITAQNRTITATAGSQTNSASAPDFASWANGVSAMSGVRRASASQTSTLNPASIVGNLRVDSFSNPTSANSTNSLTFTTTQRLQYIYLVSNASFFTSAAGGSYSLSGVASGTIGSISGNYRSYVGLLDAGSYTIAAQSQNSSGLGEFTGIGYTLSLASVNLPAVVGSPVARAENCHRYVQLAASSWLAAEEQAASMGGHLVTVNDGAEQTWLQATFAGVGPSDKWIGLRAVISGAPFTWISGESPSYTNWEPGRPLYPPFGTFDHFALYSTNGLWTQSNASTAGGIVEVSCTCDWDLDGARTSVDFFAFLLDFFAGSADIDCSGSTTSTDFFQFITCLEGESCP